MEKYLNAAIIGVVLLVSVSLATSGGFGLTPYGWYTKAGSGNIQDGDSLGSFDYDSPTSTSPTPAKHYADGDISSTPGADSVSTSGSLSDTKDSSTGTYTQTVRKTASHALTQIAARRWCIPVALLVQAIVTAITTITTGQPRRSAHQS